MWYWIGLGIVVPGIYLWLRFRPQPMLVEPEEPQAPPEPENTSAGD